MSSRMSISSPTPPSPTRFETSAPSDGSVPTWEEFLTNGSGGSLEFTGSSYPVIMNYDEPRNVNQNVLDDRGVQQVSPTSRVYPSTSSGPSSSYSSFSLQQRLSASDLTGYKRDAPVTPSSVAYPMMTTMSSQLPPPISVVRPEMKMVAMRANSMAGLPTGTQVGRWTKREHELFLEGLQRFGKSWKKISSLVHTRTLVQIRTHAQKYLQKQSRAALKADAKAASAAAAAASREVQTPVRPLQTQQRQRQQVQVVKTENHLPHDPQIDTTDQPTHHTDTRRVPSLPPCQWKSSKPIDRSNSYLPLTFSSVLSAPASASRTLSVTRTSTQIMTMTASPRSAFQLSSVNRLDQLLQEDTNNSSIPAFVDEYYTSPTAIEDDLLRPLYTGEPHWVPRLALAEASNNYSNKRRRLDRSPSACASTSTSAPTAVPALRPPFSSSVFEPLPAPSNLSSPNNSPKAYSLQQSTTIAALLAAHETDETVNYPSQWM